MFSFLWCILAKLFPCADRMQASRVSQYREHAKEISDCEEDMPLDKIGTFETSNNLSVNVYSIEGEMIVPLRTSTFENARDKIDMLLIENGEKRHYCLIKDLQKLTASRRREKFMRGKLPKKIADKRACVNIECDDKKSFKWCVLAQKYADRIQNSDHPERLRNYLPYASEFENYSYPMNPNSIRQFEEKERIAVNVFFVNADDNIEPLHISNFLPNDPTVSLQVDLLYYKKRYFLITGFSRLVRSQTTSHTTTHFVCRRCLQLCQTQKTLDAHMERCVQHKAQAVKMPKHDERMYFNMQEKQLPLPFMFVADFETILKPLDTVLPEVPEPDVPIRDSDGQFRFSKLRNVGLPEHGLRSTSSTTRIHEHEACGFAYQLISIDPRFYEPPVVYRGPNCAKEFITRLQADAERVRNWLKNPAPMPELTPEQQADFDNATHCHICEREFGGLFEEDFIKHRDHDHITGAYRGAAHDACNLNYRIDAKKIEVPCFIHNLKNYDAHLIIKAANKDHGEVKAIPSNQEKFISFSIGDKMKKVTFKDSYAFLSSSLDSLVKDLKPEDLKSTRQYLEMVEIQKRDAYIDSCSSISSEEQPDSEDLSFINDGDASSSHRIRPRYGFDDSDSGDEELTVSFIF